MADVDRCPRCAYPLTGLPGAPERVGGVFRTRVGCPECALEIPAGAHCLCGGATAGIVEPGAIRSTGAIAVAAAAAIGGPWPCIMGPVLVLQLVRAGVPRTGYSFSQVKAAVGQS